MTAVGTIQPFLLRYATPRVGQPETPGRYSAEVDVWVIETGDGEQPIVELAAGALADTQTKTMIQQEVDDDDYGASAALETSTYTKVTQEADDEDATLGLPELRTKTAVQQEQDETSVTVIRAPARPR